MMSVPRGESYTSLRTITPQCKFASVLIKVPSMTVELLPAFWRYCITKANIREKPTGPSGTKSMPAPAIAHSYCPINCILSEDCAHIFLRHWKAYSFARHGPLLYT